MARAEVHVKLTELDAVTSKIAELTARAERAERLLLDIGEAISPTGEWPREAIQQLPDALKLLDARAVAAEAEAERLRPAVEAFAEVLRYFVHKGHPGGSI
jgi:hypothetical protein